MATLRRSRITLYLIAGACLLSAGFPATCAEQPAPATRAGKTPPPEAPGNDIDNWPAGAPTPEQVMYEQPKQMRDAIARLIPQTPGKIDLYLLAFAGDGSENVFRNEVEYAARLFAQRFHAAGHTLVLENNPATLTTRPLATWTNLDTALAALHRIMDPNEDILFVYLASHGGHDYTLMVDMDPLPLDQIGAADLANMLHDHPFRWKVLVVNACFSGGFIPELKGAGTLVMTAARRDRTSFGCGNESKITFFGDAFLAHALNDTDDFIEAFAQAHKTIGIWEKFELSRASLPQIRIGQGIAQYLKRWRAQARPGPALKFAPARTHRRKTVPKSNGGKTKAAR